MAALVFAAVLAGRITEASIFMDGTHSALMSLNVDF